MRRLLAIAVLFFFPLCVIGAQECFECHDKYKKTDHGKLDCVACHSDIKDLPHADKLLKPGCASCHGEPAKQYRLSVHDRKGLACKSCHNVHTPARDTKKCAACHPLVAHKALPSARKHVAELECTGCHAKAVRGHINVKVYTGKQSMVKDIVDRNGNGFVDEKEWKDFLAHAQSVLKESYRIKRTYSVSGSAHNIGPKAVSCDSCHVENKIFQKATLEVNAAARTSIPLDPHSVVPRLPLLELYKLTSHGKGGVACRDCHVSQKRTSDAICAKCHDGVYHVYKGTSHARGSATKCTDCHNPHEVKTYRELGTAERVSVCARCHRDYMEKHKWLPHTQLHFMYLECSSCHSPRSERSMVFTVNVRTPDGERKLSHDDIVEVFGRNRLVGDLVDTNADKRIVSSELVSFFTALQKGTKDDVYVRGSIAVTEVFHDYSQIQKRERVCTTCHSEAAPFYQSMYLALPEHDGLSYLPVKGTVFSALPSSFVVNFFLLGETKMNWKDIRGFLKARGAARREIAGELGFKWIDFLGILLCLVVLFFVCVHIIIRVVFKR